MKEVDFLSCDWGTTSFRLRWVRGRDRAVLREVCEPAGIKSLHERLPVGATPSAREDLFGSFLHAKLLALFAGQPPPGRPPLIISGMASSSVGWRELPYARAPFPLDGSGAEVAELSWAGPGWLGSTFLVSGLATGQEMMRGEETEILGLMNQPELEPHRERCLVILPGTHSKHVHIEHGAVVGWRTYMTGELFEVLGRQSLLSASLELAARRPGGPATHLDRAAFQEGVLCAQEEGLAGGLFRVRTRAVLGRRPPDENVWFFSGLLVGAELASLVSRRGPVLLAAVPGLADVYALALAGVAWPSLEWAPLPVALVQSGAVSGHALLLGRR